MKKLIQIATVFFALNICSSFADAPISGKVFEKGTRKSLEGVTVYLLPHKLKTVTESDGTFKFDAVPEGDFKFLINLTGYERFEEKAQLWPNEEFKPLTLFVEKSNYGIYETTVYGRQQKKDDASKTLKAKEFSQLPGSGGDPVKAVQNLPGVNRAPGLSSQVIIQGSAPTDTVYQIDGHQVPIIFHFGGFSSVILPDAVESIDYLSAGYGPDNGRAIGGLINVCSKNPSEERWKGFAYVDLLNSGAAVEGPVGKDSSFLLGARKSYIGQVLRPILKNNDNFNLTAAPSFSDITSVYQTKLGDRDRFRLVGIGSEDKLEFLLKEPVGSDPAIRGRFESKTSFYRLIPQWTHQHGAHTTSRHSLGLGQDFIKFILTDDYFFLKIKSVTVRSEVEHQFSDNWTSAVGIDNRYAWYSVDLDLPNFYIAGGEFNPLSSGEKRQVNEKGEAHLIGTWIRNEFKMTPRWTLMPGARLDYFGMLKDWYVSPRLANKFQIDPSLLLKMGSGLYFQPPREQETARSSGNTDLVAPRALHLSLAAEKDLRGGSSQGWTVSSGPYYRKFDKLVYPSFKTVTRDGRQVPEGYANSGEGAAYGWESWIRYTLEPFTGWVSYTLGRSTRIENGRAEYLSQYDQTHNLNVILGMELESHWKFSTRFRYVTGNPITPVSAGYFDADGDVYSPSRGPYFSQRLDPFYQLDFRIDRKWIMDKWILSVYLDIQNVTNRKNIEQVQYAYDYSKQEKISGLPIIPTLGIKGEF